MGPEGSCQSKIPVTPSGIEPATCRLVAQCHRVPPTKRHKTQGATAVNKNADSVKLTSSPLAAVNTRLKTIVPFVSSPNELTLITR